MIITFQTTGADGTRVVGCYDPQTRALVQVAPEVILFGNTNHHPAVEYQLGTLTPQVVVGNVEESLRWFYEGAEDSLVQTDSVEIEVIEKDHLTRVWFEDTHTGETFFFQFHEVSPKQNIYL